MSPSLATPRTSALRTQRLTELECLGLSKYWDRITGASLYAAWPTFGGLHRAMSLFGHPVVASAVFAPLALLAFNLHVRKTVRWLAILYSAACVATLSRTGLVALAAGMLMVVAFPLEPTSRGRAAAAIATLFIAVAVIALSPLGTSPAQRLQEQDNAGRSAAISIFEHSVSTQPLSLLFGSGVGGSAAYLTSIGGNTASGLADVNVFDNQLVTSIYDYGLVPCLPLLLCHRRHSHGDAARSRRRDTTTGGVRRRVPILRRPVLA